METELDVKLNQDKLNLLFEMANLDERTLRIFVGWLAIVAGKGTIAKVAKLTGAAQNTVKAGMRQVNKQDPLPENGRLRKEGGGRKPIEFKHPEILEKIEEIVKDNSYGDPSKILFWTTLSLRDISEILVKSGYNVSYVTVGKLLEKLGYSKQQNQKMDQVGKPHPNRNDQFLFINNKAQENIEKDIPTISIDCKKKENIGNFKNSGKEYRKKGDPRRTLDHDFQIKELGHVAPYGVYVMNDNTGFINIGTSSDTSEFAVESIYRWWQSCGKNNFPDAKQLYITCDGGGSNGSRVRLWKYKLAEFAEKTGLEIHVSHFPPGTSKWNKIEHRMFCYISKSWEGKPLIDIQTVVNLISGTRTKSGLKINCVVDENIYERGIKVSDEEMASIDITQIGEFGQWNYVIRGFQNSQPIS